MGWLVSSRFVRIAALAFTACMPALVGVRSAQAQQGCQVLRYTFQPDCFRAAGSTACADVHSHIDLGPQIAVWIESADRTRFIDTLMVTNLVAARGIGNRPGLPNLISSPKFPYGKRQMALPIWAHARGVLYPAVVFQDGMEDWIGFHESVSSPDPFYCRPMNSNEVVDTITCPSPIFNSSKGRFDNTLPKSYYPPRNDLDPSKLKSSDCDLAGSSISNCTVSAATYAAMNDLDAVAAATPPYGQAYSGIWNIPSSLLGGDYAVWIEINKEFDGNAAHNHPTYPSVMPAGYGLPGNFGQPSVVYRVPIRLDATNTAGGVQSQIDGYSDWQGDSGNINPRDASITADPGSGEGRLLDISGPAGQGRVQVSLEQCAPVVCDPPPPAPTMVSELSVVKDEVTATSAIVHFRQASANGSPVSGYEIRYLPTEAVTMTPDEFSQANRAAQVLPGLPNTPTSVPISDLKANTHYVVGVRSQGPCQGESDIAVIDFTTPVMKFTQLSGCFVATAAYGSELEPEVAALRSVRDQLRPRSPLFATAIELYYRSGPAAAAVIQRSETLRALARRLLAPAAGLADLANIADIAGRASVSRAAPAGAKARLLR